MKVSWKHCSILSKPRSLVFVSHVDAGYVHIIMVCEQNFSVPENENVPALVVSVEMMPNVSPENDLIF